MIVEGSRVRHRDKAIDDEKGVMQVFNIKNGYATCGYGDFNRFGIIYTYEIKELKLE